VSGGRGHIVDVVAVYGVTEPPRPALGSRDHEYLAVLRLPQLDVALTYEIRSGSQAMSEPSCSSGRAHNDMGQGEPQGHSRAPLTRCEQTLNCCWQ